MARDRKLLQRSGKKKGKGGGSASAGSRQKAVVASHHKQVRELGRKGQQHDEFDDDIDVFHAQRDQLLLETDGKRGGYDESDGDDEPMHVMPLPGEKDDSSESSSDDDSADDDDDDDDSGQSSDQEEDGNEQSSSSGDSSSMSSDGESEGEESDEEGWGRRRKAYYGADVDDDEASTSSEEEEGREAARLQQLRARELQADDFSLFASPAGGPDKGLGAGGDGDLQAGPDDDDDDDAALARRRTQLDGDTNNTVSRDLSQLSRREQLQILADESPELLELLHALRDSANELGGRLQPALDRARSSDVANGESEGMPLLAVKYHALLSYCTAISFYLLLKASGSPVKGHPVINHLLRVRALLDKIKPLEPKLQYQIDKMLQMAARGPQEDGDQTNDQGQDALSHRPNVRAFMPMEGQEAAFDVSDPSARRSKDRRLKDKRSGAVEHGGADTGVEDELEEERNEEGVSAAVAAAARASEQLDEADADADADAEAPDHGGKYIPPRLRPMAYDGDEGSRRRGRDDSDANKRGKRPSSAMMDFLQAEYGDQPEQIGDIDGGALVHGAKGPRGRLDEDAMDDELDRQRFEEDHFVRLVETRKQRKARAKGQFRNELALLDDFGALSRLSDRVDQLDGRGLPPAAAREADGQAAPLSSIHGVLGSLERSDRAERRANALPSADADVPSAAQSASVKRKRERSQEARPTLSFGRLDSHEGDESSSNGADGNDQESEESNSDERVVKEAEQMLLAKRRRRKERSETHWQYAREPTLETLQPSGDAETGDVTAPKRKIDTKMRVNRGLVRARNKNLKNPRVRLRDKHAKALKKRRGAVRAMRQATGSAAYGGEATGIKSTVTRSIPLQ